MCVSSSVNFSTQREKLKTLHEAEQFMLEVKCTIKEKK